MSQKFLDVNGVKTLLQKIKTTFVSQSRTIAGLSLEQDIDSEQLVENLLSHIPVDQTYTPTSQNAQSGTAVAKALEEINEALEKIDPTEIIKMDMQGKDLAAKNKNLLANLDDNLIFSCSTSHGWTDMPTTSGVIFINWKYINSYNIQIAIVVSTGVVYTRVIKRSDHSVFRKWASTIDTCISYISSYTTQSGADSVENKLSNIITAGMFACNNALYTDMPIDCPNGGATMISIKASGSYNSQWLIHQSSGRMWTRTIDTSTKTVHKNWSEVGVDARMKILALGDSICRGVRNGEKGFVGDLGLPYKNIGISSASISNIVTSVMNIPDQILNLKNTEPNYLPDVIIGEGGINDWSKSAPLGEIPTIPVINDEQAEELDRSTVIGGLQYLFYKMISFYPKAQRFFLITHKTWKTNESKYCPVTQNEAGWTQQDLHDAIVKCCDVYGVKVIDVYKESMMNTIFDAYRSTVTYNEDNNVTYTNYCDFDGVHPLDYGYKECYVPLVKAALKIGTVK